MCVYNHDTKILLEQCLIYYNFIQTLLNLLQFYSNLLWYKKTSQVIALVKKKSKTEDQLKRGTDVCVQISTAIYFVT